MSKENGDQRNTEIEKLAGTANGAIDFIVKLFIWAFAFGCVTAVLLAVGFVNDFTVITAVLICVCWAAVLRHRKKKQ